MENKQILFFATESDIRPIMHDIESSFSVKYYKTGSFENSDHDEINSVDEISDFGIPKFGDWNRNLRLLMVPQNADLVIREVPQRKGGIHYLIDQLENQISISFQFGGIYKDGVLVAGNCGTAYSSEFALEIFNAFSSKLKKEFKKIGTFYVGKVAEEKLNAGWRLVTDEKSPKEYDLASS